MMKIAILTINDYMNYGNRLQNYATQEVLKSLGFTVETIVNSTNHIIKTNRKFWIRRKFKNLFGMTVKEICALIYFKLWKHINKGKIEQYKNKRRDAFKIFTLSNIKETDYNISDDNIPNDLTDRYDYFVTGSDQVWNPLYRHGSSIDFLTFAHQHKRIAYAPSFGISSIPPEYLEKYKKWLAEFKSLSVREKDGANIIKYLTDRDASVLIDPTLMLSKEKWLTVSQKASNKPLKRYLLTYFLGNVSEKNKNRIREIAEKNKLEIIKLADIQDLETYPAGPSEFIDYINSASLFCTDSFHGVVFSILFGTPFIVFDRGGSMFSMNSRIDTLLKTFKLESRLLKNIKTDQQVFHVDYSHITPILEAERKKAYHFLKDALCVQDEVLNEK